MRHLTQAPRCLRCMLHPHLCLCAGVRTETVPLSLTVVRHWKEARKPTGSAALLKLCVADCRVIDYGERDVPFDEDALRSPGSYLLLPPEPLPATPPPPPPDLQQLVLVDGTWSQARRLAARVPGLPTMPRWWLHRPARDATRLRSPHEPWARSTFEAAAEAMGALGDPAIEARLLAVFDLWVERTMEMRGHRLRPGPAD